MPNCYFFFFILMCHVSTLVFASEERVIDLGSGEVESDIQGAEYLMRIRGGLKERLSDLESDIDQTAFKDLEDRHLKIILGEDTKSWPK